MSIDDYIAKLDKFDNELRGGKIIEKATRSTMAEMVVRIFTEGRATDGTKIDSDYDTTPISIPSNATPRKPVGIPGRTSAKGNVNYRFKGGYKQFKQSIGLGRNVNLRVFNELLSDFANARVGTAKNPNAEDKVRPKKVNDFTYQIVLNKEINIQKKRGLEQKYGKKIFEATKEEIKAFNETVQFLVLSALPT